MATQKKIVVPKTLGGEGLDRMKPRYIGFLFSLVVIVFVLSLANHYLGRETPKSAQAGYEQGLTKF